MGAAAVKRMKGCVIDSSICL